MKAELIYVSFEAREICGLSATKAIKQAIRVPGLLDYIPFETYPQQ